MRSPADFLALVSGAWHLLNTTSIWPNGTLAPHPSNDSAQGPNGTGIIIYHPSYYMSALLTPTVPELRPMNLVYDEFENTTDKEWAVIGKHNLAYSAPFTLEVLDECEEDDGILTQGPLKAALVPSLEGSLFKRNFTVLEGGKGLRLKIKGDDGRIGVLTWEKIV